MLCALCCCVGREIYSWEQELDEVSIYITPPGGVTAKHIECTIKESSMVLGIKGNPPYLKVHHTDICTAMDCIDMAYFQNGSGMDETQTRV